jgi:hypothetical protein
MSSGVATNEPPGLREENPLFTFLPSKDDQTWYEKVTAGEELDQFGGPIAPGAMPGPSVGYARVVTTSIAATPTAPGYTVSEFNTCREHPIEVTYTPIHKRKKLEPLLMTGVVNIQNDEIAATQGFLVKTNDMHGKPKAVSKYAGTYGQPSAYLVESMSYDYYDPYTEKPVLVKGTFADGQSSVSSHSIQQKHIGVEEDLHIDAREYSSVSGTAAIPYDVGITISGLLITIYAHVGFPTLNLSTSSAKIATMTRTLHFPTLVHKTTVVRSGITTTAINEAFDELTGAPVVVRTHDQYHATEDDDGYVRDITLPAHYVYEGMGSAFGHDMKTIDDVDYDLDGQGHGALSDAASELDLHQADVLLVENSTMDEAATVAVLSSATVNGEWPLEELSRTSGFTGAGTGTIRIVRCGQANRLMEPAMNIKQAGNAWGSSQYPTPIVSPMTGVVSAQAHIYERDWLEYPEIGPDDEQMYYFGRKHRWHVKSTHVWQAVTTELVTSTSSTIHSSGIASTTMIVPNFYTPTTTGFIRSDLGTLWDPHNQRIEEENAIGIPSAVVFTATTGQPSCIAQNARYGSIAFESFEAHDLSSNIVADAHTGSRAMIEGSGYTNTGAVVTRRQVGAVELRAKAWIKARGTGVACTLKLNGVTYPMTIHPQVNGWNLVDCTIPGSAFENLTVDEHYEVSMDVTGASSTPLIDDVKIQPSASSMNCYVYNSATMRLIAQFDDQHYAQLFKYDQEGRLARKDKETVRGIFPIKEMHFNRPGVEYASVTQSGQSIMRDLGLNPFNHEVNWPSFDIPFSMPPTGVEATIDILRIEANPRKIRYKLFDRDSVELGTDSVARLLNGRRDTTLLPRSDSEEDR